MTDFICPFCRKPLIDEEKRLVCENSHSFDKAREGYVHLLPVNKMHSKVPGDTKEMVLSRRKFLQSGYYDIFSEKLNEIVCQYAENGSLIVDAGCGEGFYTERMLKSLKRYENIRISAFDISKYAVKYASKSSKNIGYAVASIFDIPIADEKADIVTDIFAPIVENEFFRILKRGGILIIAVPSQEHLMGLKNVVYEEPYKNEVKDTFYDGFDLVSRIPVRDKIIIDSSEDIDALFTMTPYYLKTSIEGCQRVNMCKYLETEIGFDFLVYRKR